jgi:hypothetical protein
VRASNGENLEGYFQVLENMGHFHREASFVDG